MKKEILIPLLIFVLSVAFIIISFMVFVTKGKRYYFIKQKLKLGGLILTLSAIFNTNTISAKSDMVKCYKKVASNYMTLSYDYNKGYIEYSISKAIPLKGSIQDVTIDEFSFRIVKKDTNEVILFDNIVSSDGKMDKYTEQFEIVLKDIKEGEYTIQLFRFKKEKQIDSNYNRTYPLKVIK